MVKWLVGVGIVVLAALTAIAAVFLLGMRSKCPAVVDRVRRFNRIVTNPRVLRSAGSPGAAAAVIRHVGRTSGRAYETPVGPFAVGDDVVVALPYGSGTDWVRNVLANGSATIVHEGRTVSLYQPEVIPTTEIVRELPKSEQRTLRLFRVDHCLRLRRAPIVGETPERSGTTG